MPTVPFSRQPKRQPQPMPDSKYLLMAMANMHNAGRVQVGPPDSSASPSPQPEVASAMESMK